jgi:hypothetical protein
MAEDLRNLAGNQAVLQSQIDAQAAAARNAGRTGVELQELLHDLPTAEERVETLETSRTSLENTNQAL